MEIIFYSIGIRTAYVFRFREAISLEHHDENNAPFKNYTAVLPSIVSDRNPCAKQPGDDQGVQKGIQDLSLLRSQSDSGYGENLSLFSVRYVHRPAGR